MGAALRCGCCARGNRAPSNMAAGQLWLFDPPKPLVDRFGAAFFRALPTDPGVYLLCGESAGVLYVGKARNLRRRLSSYRVANPERLSRRMLRLLHLVRRIEWDVCVSEAAALEREAWLICVLQPRFNRAGQIWSNSPAWQEAKGKLSEVPLKACSEDGADGGGRSQTNNFQWLG